MSKKMKNIAQSEVLTLREQISYQYSVRYPEWSYAGRVRTDPEQYPEDFQADQQQDHAGVLLCKL